MDKMATRYFYNDNDRCRFRELENGTFEVAMLEILPDDDVEVFYLERFRKFENAVEAMHKRGVGVCDEFMIPETAFVTKEEMYWIQACV